MQPSNILLLVASAICASAGKGNGWDNSPKARYGDLCGDKNDLLAKPFCTDGFQCVSYGKKIGNRCTPQNALNKPCGQALQYPPVCAPGLQCAKAKKKSGGIVGGATGTCMRGHCGSIGDKCNSNKPCTTAIASSPKRFYDAFGNYGFPCGTNTDHLVEPFCNKGLKCFPYGGSIGNRCTPESGLNGPCDHKALQFSPVCAPGLKCVKSKYAANKLGGASGKCVKGVCGKSGGKCNASMPCQTGLMCSVSGDDDVGACMKSTAMCKRKYECPPGFTFQCPKGCQPDCPFAK
ncbi:hypothetical protein HDU81_003908 [Chytriomyces hyalinus]|nr:hypothetical protein HDU81_003908 [Chytriomyces hyalinus]